MSSYVSSGVEMAVWGGRYKFEDTSVTRRDFTSPPYKRPVAPHERISSAPTVTQTYWKQQQPLRPRDHFASPKPLMPGSAHRRSPCPLGCPCNQNQQPANFEQRENFEYNRWSSNNKYNNNNCSASYMSSMTPTAPKYSTNVFSNPPPYQRDLRAHNVASAIHKVQAFQPQPAIPVGWGKVDLTTVYNQNYTVPGTVATRSAPLTVSQNYVRPESPPRWETSYYSAFCKNLLQVTRGY